MSSSEGQGAEAEGVLAPRRERPNNHWLVAPSEEGADCMAQLLGRRNSLPICGRPALTVAVLTCLLVSGLSPAVSQGVQEQMKWRGVWEWSMDQRSEAGLVAIADACHSLGFNVLMMAPPRNRIAFMAETCHARGIRLYLSTVFSGGDPAWQQVMTAEERARRDQPVPATHQHGGEPRDPGEVFESPAPCWNRPEVRNFLRTRVQEWAKLPVDGLAFDYIGYANYRRCYCPVCQEKLSGFLRAHPNLLYERAAEIVAEDTLVSFTNEMAAAAREVRPEIELTIHVYPYFLPNPFYGNRLELDTVGQTVSWFFRPHWPLEKVRRLTENLVAGQHDYVASATAAPFLGFYEKPPRDYRSSGRIAAELAILRDSGAGALQMAELGSLVRKPRVAEAVARALGGDYHRTPVPGAQH